jgi:large subunit ribosomal protein L17
LWNGKIETTFARAKAIQKLADKYLTLAINTYQDVLKVTKTKKVKGVDTQVEVLNDGPTKLAARRRLMARLSDMQETKGKKESLTAYRMRTEDVKHPLIEKMFNEYAPKFDKRSQELGQKGGYTAVHKLGMRRGDAAQMALIEILPI